MKKLQCELCGSVDFVRTDDGMFQCQCCGCKYTIEQAKTILNGTEVRTKAIDFEIVGGVLKKYNGEDVHVVIPDNVTIIGQNVFEGLAINSVVLSDNVQIIESQAFSNCTNLTEVRLSDNLTSIGESAFFGCSSLTEIVLPKNIRKIQRNTFQKCKALSSVTLPENLKVIGESAFAECRNLAHIEFPESLELIEKLAFQNCRSLSGIRIPEKVRICGMTMYSDDIDSYEDYAFRGCKTSDYQFVGAWIGKNRCRYCGGRFKGFSKRVCTECGREKDYY